MSRIDFDELSYTDVEWYGIDKKGNIAVFCSAGKASVPEFVCANKERYELLVEYFETLPPISEVQVCFECSNDDALPIQVAEAFSHKGLYYYDSDDRSKAKSNIGVLQKYYTISSKPTNPINYSDLPKYIQELLNDNSIPVDDFEVNRIIEIKDAC